MPAPPAAENSRLVGPLALAMVGVFLLDLALPRNIPLLPYYFLMVVLSASRATPRQMIPLIVLAYALAIASGLHWGFFPSIDYLTRLLALSGVTGAALLLSAQRSHATAERRRSEHFLTLIVDQAAAGVGLADASGRLIRVNAALCAILRRDAESLLGLSWSQISHPDDIAREQPLMEEMLANRRDSYRLKKRYLRGDGSFVWLDVSISCVRKADGQLDLFIGQAIDISQEVTNQEALAHSEQLLRRTLEQCNVGLALCAPRTGAILQANAQLSALLGLAPSVLEGSDLAQVFHVLERVPVEDAEAGEAMDTAALEALLHGETDDYRVRVKLEGAGRRKGWGELRLSSIREAGGGVLHVLLEIDDISELVARTEYLQAAAAAGVVGIWEWDAVHDEARWDPVMVRLYGRQSGDACGAYQAWFQSLHPDDRAGVEAELQAALRGERDYSPHFRVIWPDGSVHHLKTAARVSFDAQGQPIRMLGVNYDVTDLVQTQERLQLEQQRLSTTLDSLLEPHLILGPVRDEHGAIMDLCILRANPPAAAYNHMALEAFIGARVREFWPEHMENGLFDRYLDVLRGGPPLVLDSFPFQHRQQGSLRYLDIRAVNVGEELSVTWRDVSERIAAEQELQHRAATDGLTGLLNREEMFSRIQILLSGEQQRRGDRIAALFCDLDHFKAVNDRYGHQVGDTVLQTMASRIRTCLRSTDLAARIGGDELMVVLPGIVDLQDALTIAEKLRQRAHEPLASPLGEVPISLSIGVALAKPGETLDALIARADAALYAAKQRGRDQVVTIAMDS